MEENVRSRLRERCKLGFAVLCGLVCGISCMSIDLGQHIEAPPNTGTLRQDGTFEMTSTGIGVVYYPRPYISPPNLEVSTGRDLWRASDYVELIDQKPDQFRYRLIGSPPSWISFRWKAAGVPASLASEPAIIKNVPADPPPTEKGAESELQPTARTTPAAPPPPPTPIK